MHCPRCHTAELVERDRTGITIDICNSCRGVWLDRGELDKLIALSVERDGGGGRDDKDKDDDDRGRGRGDRDRDRKKDDDDDDDDDRRGGRRGGFFSMFFD